MGKDSFIWMKPIGLGLIILLLSSHLSASEKAYCSAYARDSVLDQIQNVKSGCQFDGALWSSGVRRHHAWCRDNTLHDAKKNSLIRQQELERCDRTMQRDLSWSELDFTIQNKLFGELIMAVAMDDLDSLKLFERDGVDLNFEWRLIHGGLLYWAISNQASEVVHYLIENKAADPNLTANGGPNPLVRLINNRSNVNYPLLEYLLQNGARPNHGGEEYSDASYPLTTAASNNDLESVKILLNHHANPNLYESTPPLMMAANHDNEQMVDLLLRFGANPNLGINGSSCGDIDDGQKSDLFVMDSAQKNGSSRVVKILNQVGAKTTQQCFRRPTGLEPSSPASVY